LLYASIHVLVPLAISLATLATSSDSERDLEILALRHQVAVLRRQVKGPELVPADRFVFAALGLRMPPGRLMFSPATCSGTANSCVSTGRLSGCDLAVAGLRFRRSSDS